MSMFRVQKPQCRKCEHHQSYGQPIPLRAKGIMLHLGDHYCACGKKYRKLKAREFKDGVPSNCPRLKKPPLLRIYCFKNSQAMEFGKMFPCGGYPSAHEYAMRYQGDSPVPAWALCEGLDLGENPLDIPLHTDEVLEIDDGFCPYFFQNTVSGLIGCPFDREAALKNKLERDIPPERSVESND